MRKSRTATRAGGRRLTTREEVANWKFLRWREASWECTQKLTELALRSEASEGAAVAESTSESAQRSGSACVSI